MNQHYFDVPFAFSGDVTVIPDPLQSGGTVSMTEGWNYNYQRDLSTDPAALPIDRSTMNWLLQQITTAIQALQQTGCPEFITSAQNGGTAFSYGKGSRVLWSASGNAPFTKFVSLVQGNTQTPSLSDPTGATTGWQIDVDPISTSAQAAAGTDNASIMTPLLVAQQTALRALLAGSSSQVFNVGPGTALTHAPEIGQVQAGAFNYAGLAGGTANAITATLTPAPTAYSDWLVVTVRVASNNTGSTSINVNGLGVKAVIGAGHQLLQGGELVAGGFATFAYSTNFSEAILLQATGGGEPVGLATQSNHAAQFSQVSGAIRYGGVVELTSGSGNWTVPANVTLIEVEGWGAGGGSSGSATTQAINGAGGGGYFKKLMTVTPGQVIAYSVGAGGAPQPYGSTGSSGGNTTFGTLTANGGGGSSYTSTGGGGAASGGDLNIAGTNGAPYTGTGGANVTGGGGGASPRGGGGGSSGVSTAANGNTPGGGAGGPGSGSAVAGATGGNGLIYIRY